MFSGAWTTSQHFRAAISYFEKLQNHSKLELGLKLKHWLSELSIQRSIPTIVQLSLAVLASSYIRTGLQIVFDSLQVIDLGLVDPFCATTEVD